MTASHMNSKKFMQGRIIWKTALMARRAATRGEADLTDDDVEDLPSDFDDFDDGDLANSEANVDEEPAALLHDATSTQHPQERFVAPTLDEYQKRWAESEQRHAQEVHGEFGRENLVPQPCPRLWQDAPHVPFKRLRRSEAQSSLSVCRPHCTLEPARCIGGVGNFAHLTGDVRFKRRAPLQLAATMNFILNKKDGSFMGLTEQEVADVHECLSWGRESLDGMPNNRHIQFFGTVFEAFLASTGPLMS